MVTGASLPFGPAAAGDKAMAPRAAASDTVTANLLSMMRIPGNWRINIIMSIMSIDKVDFCPALSSRIAPSRLPRIFPRRARQHAAIDHQRLACDVRRGPRDEQQRRADEFLRRGEPAGRDETPEPAGAIGVVPQRAREFGAHEAGLQSIDLDIVADPL